MKTYRQEYQHNNLGEHVRSRTKPVIGGLLLGGLIGAGTALLFAPQSGERTRANIQNKTVELRDRTTDAVKDTVSQVKSKTHQMTSDVLGKANELVDRGKEALGYQQVDDTSQTTNRRTRTIQGH